MGLPDEDGVLAGHETSVLSPQFSFSVGELGGVSQHTYTYSIYSKRAGEVGARRRECMVIREGCHHL